jgi:hypothetical protein
MHYTVKDLRNNERLYNINWLFIEKFLHNKRKLKKYIKIENALTAKDSAIRRSLRDQWLFNR